MLTGFHGFHVFVGMLMLLFITLRLHEGPLHAASATSASKARPGTGTSSTWSGSACTSSSTGSDAPAPARSDKSRRAALFVWRAQLPSGMPVGWIQPSFQSRAGCTANSSDRQADAHRQRAHHRCRACGLPSRPSRSMNTPALASAPSIAEQARARSRSSWRDDYRTAGAARALSVRAARRWLRRAAGRRWRRALLTARLGLWQLDRAAQKTALQAALDARGACRRSTRRELARTRRGRRRRSTTAACVCAGRWLAAHTRLPRQPADERPARLLRRHAAARSTAARRGAGAARLGAARLRRDRSRAAAGAPRRRARSRCEGRIAPPPARLYEFDAARAGRDPAKSRPRRLRPRDRAGPAAAVGAAEPTRRRCRRRPAARTGRRPRSTSTSTTAMPSSGSRSRALIAGLYVWFQLIRPRRRRADADAAAA